ncbi:MAG: hypothetical protein EXS15_02185 [Phycisphaerales bacterium]|nr:hypothetical protein [Phycisphaerales bacterium]
MITSTLFAAQLFLAQQNASQAQIARVTQDAVLVIKDPRGLEAVGMPEHYSVSFPHSVAGAGPVDLTELRSMVEATERSIERPAMEWTIDQTIGGRSKEKTGDGDEGGIAGVDVPLDIQFRVTSGSLIPPAQLAAFTAAVASVESYFESQIDTPNLTLVLRLAYVPLGTGRLGVTTGKYSTEKYSTVSNAINASNDAEGELYSVPPQSTLAVRYSGVSTASTPENRVFVVRPLLLALGIQDSGPTALTYDGTISLNSAIQWDFDPSNGLAFGQSLLYSFQDHLIREIAQCFGFVAGADFLSRDCTIMDLFRFQTDVINELYLVNFHTLAQLACAEYRDALMGYYESGSLPNGWALDYNPGLNQTMMKSALDEGILSNTLLQPAINKDPVLYFHDQIRGRLNGSQGAMTVAQGNVFDDLQLTIPPNSIADTQRTPWYPEGAAQSIYTFGADCVVVDFRRSVFTLNAAPNVPIEFRGAMPRTVARNSAANSSILNFIHNSLGVEEDFEMEMYDGSPIRGAFVKQDELADLVTRCLMGKEIGKGNTWFTRDPVSATQDPFQQDLELVQLGILPDFLSRREWLALDAMGWRIDMPLLDETNEGDAPPH